MLDGDARQAGVSIRVHYADNTFRTVVLQSDSSAAEVVEWVRSPRVASERPSGGRLELCIIYPVAGGVRTQRLLPDERPLHILAASGGGSAFKFVLRRITARAMPADGVHLVPTGPIARPPRGDSAPVVVDMSGAAGVPVSDASGHLRTGELDRLLEDGRTWHTCTVVLDEDRLWFSLPPTVVSGMGGGMASIMLQGCDSARPGDERREFLLFVGPTSMAFRAKTVADQEAWLLIIVRQAALVKEREMLLQADRIIASVELQRTTRRLSCLDTLQDLPGVLFGPRSARQLFLDFARSEHATAQRVVDLGAIGDTSVGRGRAWGPLAQVALSPAMPRPTTKTQGFWPKGLDIEEFMSFLVRQVDTGVDALRDASLRPRSPSPPGAAHADPFAPGSGCAPRLQGEPSAEGAPGPWGAAAEAEAWAFASGALFRRFQEHPAVQCRLCRIAAGIA